MPHTQPLLCDSHCHLAHPALLQRLPEVLAEARAAGVGHFLVPATGAGDWAAVCTLATQPEITIALGIHPWQAAEHHAHHLAQLETLLLRQPTAWVGEIGLDFYPPRQQHAPAQQHWFRAQLILAQDLQRPVIIHSLKAGAATLAAIRETGFQYGGLAHAFSGSLEEARLWLKLGFKIGIGSLLLNPRARKIRHVAANLALTDLVLETDAPYGQGPALHNHPQNTRHVAEAVAQLHQTDWQQVAAITRHTLQQLQPNKV